MPIIFVDTDKKLFNGSRAGNSKAKAEEKMQKAVKKIIDKADGFTTTKSENAKGYALSLTVAKVEVIGLKTKCSLTAVLSRYPKQEMVSSSITSNGAVDGASEGAVLDCIEALAADVATKSLPIMRKDDVSRR